MISWIRFQNWQLLCRQTETFCSKHDRSFWSWVAAESHPKPLHSEAQDYLWSVQGLNRQCWHWWWERWRWRWCWCWRWSVIVALVWLLLWSAEREKCWNRVILTTRWQQWWQHRWCWRWKCTSSRASTYLLQYFDCQQDYSIGCQSTKTDYIHLKVVSKVLNFKWIQRQLDISFNWRSWKDANCKTDACIEWQWWRC